MTVEQERVIDIISIRRKTGEVCLTICDHLEWSDSSEHQRTLQAKLNAYLAFVESGEILASYPNAKDRPVVIEIAFKFCPDADGLRFLAKALEIISSAGFELRYEVSPESDEE